MASSPSYSVVRDLRVAELLESPRYQNPTIDVSSGGPLLVALAALLSDVKMDTVLVRGYMGPQSWQRALIAGPAQDVNAPDLPFGAETVLECGGTRETRLEYDPSDARAINRLAFLVHLVGNTYNAIAHYRKSDEYAHIHTLYHTHYKSDMM